MLISIEGRRLLAALEAFQTSPEGARSPEAKQAADALSQSLRQTPDEGLTPGQREVQARTNNTPSREVHRFGDSNSDELTPGDKAILDVSPVLPD